MSELRFEWGATTAQLHYSRYDLEPLKTKPRASYRVLLEKGQDRWIVARCLDV